MNDVLREETVPEENRPSPQESPADSLPAGVARGRMGQWLERQMDGHYGSVWLYLISFAESSFFPIPPDFFMFPVILRAPARWRSTASIVTLASVFGALFGYAVGFFAFDLLGKPLVMLYHLEEELMLVSSYFNAHAFLAIFTAAFTPIPYKLFTIAGGLFRLDLVLFVAASFLGRGMRFFAVAYIVKFFGERLAALVFRYFNLLTGVVAAGAVLYVIAQFI
ncbi:MAG: hypothetical protein Greene041679_100 [Parcubacteria group bacterium Greene0416_79]|nr:MAG: hypothetical protein Greene041679_100 [Parcubacteria group bacterium Greene0416_79]